MSGPALTAREGFRTRTTAVGVVNAIGRMFAADPSTRCRGAMGLGPEGAETSVCLLGAVNLFSGGDVNNGGFRRRDLTREAVLMLHRALPTTRQSDHMRARAVASYNDCTADTGEIARLCRRAVLNLATLEGRREFRAARSRPAPKIEVQWGSYGSNIDSFAQAVKEAWEASVLAPLFKLLDKIEKPRDRDLLPDNAVRLKAGFRPKAAQDYSLLAVDMAGEAPAGKPLPGWGPPGSTQPAAGSEYRQAA